MLKLHRATDLIYKRRDYTGYMFDAWYLSASSHARPPLQITKKAMISFQEMSTFEGRECHYSH